jgi:IstB-like ATP binding protein.
VKRAALDLLLKWSQTSDVRPVVITGAKGVGKTYLACDFAKSFYKQYVYVNLEHDKYASELFKLKDPFRISNLLLEHYFVERTVSSQDNLYDERLLILDEAGYCPEAFQMLTELQYTGEFPHIIAISSNPVKKRYWICISIYRFILCCLMNF